MEFSVKLRTIVKMVYCIYHRQETSETEPLALKRKSNEGLSGSVYGG